MSNKVVLFLIVLKIAIISSCSFSKKEQANKSKSTKVNLEKFECSISGRDSLSGDFQINQFVTKSNQQKWVLKYNFSLGSKKISNETIYGTSRAILQSNVMKALMKIPHENPMSANFKYEKKKIKEVEPIEGSKIDTLALSIFLNENLKKENLTVNLDKAGFYIRPSYDLKHEKTKEAKLAFEKCLKSEIKLKYEDKEFIVDSEVFGTWMHLDTSMKVEFETEPIQAYLQSVATKIEIPLSELLKSYNLEDTAAISKVIFSRLNINTQVNELLKLFPVGKKIESDLIISKRGLPKGVKSGYKDFVEVSIAEQKLWLFKDGNLLLETDVVTGNKRRGRSTPLGEYSVKAKARNVVLRGRDYASFVSYWMPFHGGYGLHDANWRRRFGSQIYVSGGSHGCVNIPPKYAPLVYSNTNVGTPVIIVN